MFQLALPFVAVILVGIGIAIETPTNALLMKQMNSAVVASLASFVVGTLTLAVTALVMRPKLADGFVASTPGYAWTGGLYGGFVVLASAWATPRLGAGTTLVVIVAAQVAVGVLLDQLGWLGLEQHPASWLRLAGVAFVVVGAVLVARG